MAPFQKERDSGPSENDRPNQGRLGVRLVGQEQQNRCYQKQRPGEHAVICPILECVSKAADRHSEQTGYRRRRMQWAPKRPNGYQNCPRGERYNQPVANGGTAAATNGTLALCPGATVPSQETGAYS